MLVKNLIVFILSLFALTSCQIFSTQTKNIDGSQNTNKKPVSKTDVPEFYQKKNLESDYIQVDVVAYVNIKERALVDFIGNGDCENDKGTGYCLYRLKADLKEVFKGNISQSDIEFYTSPDADYQKKNLMGERVVFLNWSDNYPDKKLSLGELENSTRSIEYEILKKMQNIANKKNQTGKIALSLSGGVSPLYKTFSRKSPDGGAVNLAGAFEGNLRSL